MPNELQSPNYNEGKASPELIAANVSAALEGLAKEHNNNPSKFMAKMNGNGDTLGLGSMQMNNPMYEKSEKGASHSSFLMMGKGRSKAHVRWDQLKSDTDALGMPKTYKQKITDSRILNGGRAKKNHDPFSGGGDRSLVEQHNIARQSLGTEGGYVSPQGIRANMHIAMQLGGGELFNTLLDANREKTAPSEFRALNGAADGNDQLKDAAKLIGDDVKVNFVAKQDDPKIANLLLSPDEARKVKPAAPKMPKPPGMEGPSPSSSGLMDS